MKNNVKVQDDTQSLQSCVSVSVTDLRIGNLILFEENQIKVTGIDKFFIHWGKSNFAPMSLKIFEYIPLNEEWILKFGIGKQNGYPYKFLNGYLKIRNGVYFFKYYDLEVELPFVHLLQNLHYALKGSELQIGNLTEH